MARAKHKVEYGKAQREAKAEAARAGKAAAKRPRGRPSMRTPEIEDEICRRLAEGEGLIQICRDDHMPNRVTVVEWVGKYEDFGIKYREARLRQAECYGDQIIDIADEMRHDALEVPTEDGGYRIMLNSVAVARAKLKIDARHLRMKQLDPRTYGDRQALDITGGVTTIVVSPAIVRGKEDEEE